MQCDRNPWASAGPPDDAEKRDAVVKGHLTGEAWFEYPYLKSEVLICARDAAEVLP